MLRVLEEEVGGLAPLLLVVCLACYLDDVSAFAY